MATKQHVFVEVVELPMIGPESNGIRYCAKCRKPIKAGEHWRKVARVGGVAVGVHVACYLQGPAGER